MIRKLNFIFTKSDKVIIFFLLIAIIFGSFLEMAAVAVFSPFIDLIMDTTMLEKSSMLL